MRQKRDDIMFADKIRRGIKGSCNLIKIVFRKLNQISESVEDNTVHWTLAAGRFDLGKIIESIDSISLPKKEYDGKKIKVCILAEAFNYWTALESICRAFEQDSKYDVCVLISEATYDVTKLFLEENFQHRYCHESEYNIEKERPDIFLFSHSGLDIPSAQNCLKYRFMFKLVIAIHGEVITHSSDDEEWDPLRRYRFYMPDYYIIDPLLYEFLMKRQQTSRTTIALNNAKYDEIYAGVNSAKYSPDNQWDKLRDKKTILWGTTHGVSEKIAYPVTFDLYAKPFFDYAREHTDVGFVVRLHPAFIREMREQGFWTLGDLARLREYCRKSPNIVWDENPTYNRAYSVADGILTDGYCGMIISALPLMKPICACYRFDYDVGMAHRDYVQHLYQAHSVRDMYDFFDMVAAGEDPMYEKREYAREKYIGKFDGKNGQRIKEFIERTFFEEVCN